MKLLFLWAALLPGLYWDQGIDTADTVKQVGIRRLYVPVAREGAWRGRGFDALPFNPAGAGHVKAEAPGVQYHINEASATTEPWIDANGWRFERDPAPLYYYDVPPGSAALAAAEASVYGVDAVVHAAAADLDPFARMLAFLQRIGGPRLPPMANIGIVDDGSGETGEVMNLLARRNLLFRVVKAPDRKYDLNIRIGSSRYPRAEAGDPYEFAMNVRRELGDEKRLLRIYGSQVVIGQLTGDGRRARVYLLDYAPRKAGGLRVRVLGAYAKGRLAAFGADNTELQDYLVQEGATEFTIPEFETYAVVDLER